MTSTAPARRKLASWAFPARGAPCGNRRGNEEEGRRVASAASTGPCAEGAGLEDDSGDAAREGPRACFHQHRPLRAPAPRSGRASDPQRQRMLTKRSMSYSREPVRIVCLPRRLCLCSRTCRDAEAYSLRRNECHRHGLCRRMTAPDLFGPAFLQFL